ncbi:chemotaxis protein CheA [Shewanella xiamenensis]|uniref:chemotaxis protein CheA n=1 Tax=Shewanella xiamenensis TaxID=332186 RepID=UPI0004D6FB6B|nr:chemotaxis protein CheA [Shewanella xiamenensis]KEK28296.1 CheW-like protein [Shewanella xiamenensis]
MTANDVQKLFMTEAEELLTEMEDALLSLEVDAESTELINQLFRAMHTIKGAAGIFNYRAIVDFTHPIETSIDRLRKNELKIDSALIALLLKCKDHTWALVNAAVEEDEAELNTLCIQSQSILAELAQHENLEPCYPQTLAAEAITPERIEGHYLDTGHWLISLDFKADALRNGLDPLSFIRYLHQLGQVLEVICLSHKLPPFEECDFESCFLRYRIIFAGDCTKEQIESVFEFAQDDCDIQILPSQKISESFQALIEQLNPSDNQRLGEILLSIGAITERELTKSLDLQSGKSEDCTTKKLGEVLIANLLVDKPVVEQALKKQIQAREQAQTIRVDSNRLGQLINLVGELVTASAAMKVMVDRYQFIDANDLVGSVEHLVQEIRENALQLRMVQIGETFSRFRRVVRDVSNELGKQIELTIQGGESELDKIVVEKINDPLTHLVRNALDHGIELPEARLKAGKSAEGHLMLNAYHDSGHIVIEVTDDGAGLDPERIRRKAEALGLIDVNQMLSHSEILKLAFEPGLSTKDKASNLSGRGVGMDVVKRNIEALRGSVELDSELGKGTKVTITLPLTLAIIDGFMVGAANENYVIPLNMVEECVELNRGEWHEQQKNYISLRGELMPFIRLKSFFNIPNLNQNHTRESLVVVRFGRTKAGIVVDKLFGEQQTVIKPLGKMFQHLKGLSGATILGTGDIALILDVQGLITEASISAKKYHHVALIDE